LVQSPMMDIEKAKPVVIMSQNAVIKMQQPFQNAPKIPEKLNLKLQEMGHRTPHEDKEQAMEYELKRPQPIGRRKSSNSSATSQLNLNKTTQRSSIH